MVLRTGSGTGPARRRKYCHAKLTDLREVEVTLLLQPLQMHVHLPQLRLEILESLVWLRRSRAVASDRRAAARSRASCVQVAAASAARGERCNGSGCVGGHATSPCDGVVALATVVGVPEALGPLKELEVIPADWKQS